MTESLRGKLLVAGPSLADPNFYRTVVFVLEHTADGAAGVVLNRPSETAVHDPLPQWGALAADPAVLFVGGPVQPNGVICLARPVANGTPPGFQELAGGIGSLDLEQDALLAAPGVEALRIFAGYSGWGGGQLESELAEDAWLVLDALPEDVFTPDPPHLWRAVFRRQPDNLRLLANFPPHPSLN